MDRQATIEAGALAAADFALRNNRDPVAAAAVALGFGVALANALELQAAAEAKAKPAKAPKG